MKKIFLLFLIITIVSGCGLFGKKSEKTATELLNEARQEFEDEDYLDAVELFQDLKNWYPFSEHVKEAEIKIADSYFEMEKYEEAIRAYEIFERLHPLDSEAPKASFRVGEAYYKQILTIDRDQSNTKAALKNFLKFQKNYPDSQYLAKAQEFIDKCINQIAESQFYVADFYFRQKAWEASKVRLEDIIQKYAGTESAKKALEMLSKIPKTPELENKN